MTKGDFKPYQKGFGYKRFNRLLKLQEKYMVIPNRPGWEQTPNGLMPPPTPIAGSTTANQYWNLTLSTETPKFLLGAEIFEFPIDFTLSTNVFFALGGV